MMDLKSLCEKIELPSEVLSEVLSFDQEFDYSAVLTSMDKLFDCRTWEEGRMELKTAIGKDRLGIGMLACMLRCALKTWQNYQRLGIGEDIFVDTMKVFSRFVQEHQASFGVYGFDRDWWTARQLSLTLVRLGELEYERKIENGKPCIHVHIPSDARLLTPLLQESYQKALRFFSRFFPDYASVYMYCHSWLLSPALPKVLPEGSHILEFQRAFVLQGVDEENDSFLEWVFKRKDIPLSKLPENTSLQRNLKRYVLEGGKVGEGIGLLREGGF